MTEYINLKTPLSDSTIEKLKAGDKVRISGILYTGRDAAHKRLIEMIESGEELPFDVKGQLLYYVGPTPAKPGQVIGSAGPTTSYRMDAYAPTLIKMGLKGMIGKGGRSKEVIEAMKTNKAVYFAAVGGAAALIAKTIKRVEIIAFEDLGTEAVRKMEVENFPAIVVNDTKGNDLYNIGREKYKIPV
ncbi:MAG: Fe-S-containing hydro-lyase [Candidatus Scalindua sp.]|jgi:fumarate hydratase subunit beta|nr:Fe-S-containing hydro-lyase [Candidatus Scalindua sp.]MBT6228434.1 Fe-S-containing hydro-lyase [Candidatus Scalindua sp.]MBT6563849.1 Fe-S-containing hydro-lyase [Candidatus Scalindua sp.]MBT7211196.1 Fe-S-containing hydro-lyase [Candidatus Scalindua sp.]MBT7592702.1 Fe-S-containing hydro-lyase [Candidatus Scalindua sp.]